VIVPHDRARRLAAAAGWIAAVLPLAVVLLSAAIAPASNWIVRTGLAAFCTLAILRPDAALLATTAFVGFGIILSHLAGVPTLRVTEVLVVASLAGCCTRAVPHDTAFRRALTGSISVPVVLFALAAVAAAVVWQRVQQFETGYPAEYLERLAAFLTRDYFVQPGEFWELVSTAVILEGLALFVVVAALCQADAAFSVRALRMLCLGGAGLAVMSVVRLAEILLRNPGAIDAMRATYAGLRISPQIPDYIAAGSYFSLCWLVALGLALTVSRSRLVWLAAGVPLLAALYMTGSRSVIAAALVGVVFLVLIVVRQRVGAIRGVVAFAALAIALMTVAYPWITGRDIAGETARQSLIVRRELLRTGLRVMETRPVFGVGIDRFYLLAGGLASPELRTLWNARMNPHNDFLRFGAELGLVGLASFVWILAAAGRRTWTALERSRDPLLAGLGGGVVAFLVTSLVSNPLMVREVSYAFWIALGLAVGHAARTQAPSDEPADEVVKASAAPRWGISRRTAIAVLVGGLLVLSVPFRARQEVSAADPTRVSYGFFEWSADADGTAYRWSGPRATLFVDGRAEVIDIPLSAPAPSGVVQHVEIRVDGRLANRVAVGREWQRVRMILRPRAAPEAHRIDLAVSPTWVPAEVIPRNEDRRALGVKVGRIDVITRARQDR